MLALSLALSICACSKSDKTPSLEEIVENSPTSYIDFLPDAQWLDGIGFGELSPGEEIKSSSEIIIDADNSTIQFVITYSRSGLVLEYGLQTEDGTEYSRKVVGGSDIGTIKDIPKGTYFLFVRNSGDYSELPAYQDKSITFSATGAINYYLVGESAELPVSTYQSN